jgi:hypothetical protein
MARIDLNNFDVITKDEGKFYIITFQSDKSKKFAKDHCLNLENDSIVINKKNIKNTLCLFISHNLSIFEF